MTSLRIVCAVCLLFGCDKGKPEPAAPPPSPQQVLAAEKHFDVSADKSGVLARAAAVLEADGIDNEDLRELSHHAEKLPSAAVVCQHVVEVRKSTGGIKDCVEETEHHIAELGPEIWAEASQCFLAATTTDELDACAAAEKEAEKLLHDKPHGDGLDKASCEGFFEKFKQLAVEAQKDDGDHVAQVLDVVRDNVIRTCMEQGTQVELDCADSSKTLHELEECAKDLM